MATAAMMASAAASDHATKDVDGYDAGLLSEVAARVIQHHFRVWRQRRLSLLMDVENDLNVLCLSESESRHTLHGLESDDEQAAPTPQPSQQQQQRHEEDCRRDVVEAASFGEEGTVRREPDKNALGQGTRRAMSDVDQNAMAAARVSQSTDKLRDILSYLERADRSAQILQYERENAAPPQSTGGASGASVAPGRLSKDASGFSRGDVLPPTRAIPNASTSGTPSFAKQEGAISAVCSGVHTKIRGLQDRLHEQGQALGDAEERVAQGLARERKLELDFKASLSDALDRQSKEHEKSLARHLSFIDRILKDKDLLSKKCERMAEDLKAVECMYNAKADKLNAQWSDELKKQKQVWASAEKARREVWLADKTKEIRELTIKGLEPEIQRLVQKHKAEVEELEAKHAQVTKDKVSESRQNHAFYVDSLREQWRRERDDLIEHERSVASNRLREQAERYDAQLDALRMRLVSDFDAKLTSIEATKREEQSKHENAISWLRKKHNEEVNTMSAEFDRQFQGVNRRHENEKAAMKDKFQAEQEGWRDMIVKRLHQEFSNKEESMRRAVQTERNAEIEVVVTRLEEEAQLAREAHDREHAEAVQAMRRDHQKELRELQDKMSKYTDMYREAKHMQQRSEKEISTIDSLNKASSREIAVKAETISFLEKQLAASRKETEQRDKDIRAMYQERLDVLQQKLASASEIAKQGEDARKALSDRLAQQETKAKADMDEIEGRVKDAILKRDQIIHKLQNELEAMSAELGA